MKKQWFNLQSKGSHLDIYLYGVIGGWDVDIQTFMDQLKSVPNPDTVNVFINTIGGTFNDGLPIFNTIAQLNAFVTTKVMGYALSMGSILMLAGDKVQMAQNSMAMIHRAQGGLLIFGDADLIRKEVNKEADILEVHEAGFIKLYAQRMNLSEAEVLALLKEETWFTADKALEAGLIDEIIDPIDLSKAADEALAGKEAIDTVSNYHNIPIELSTLITKRTAKSGLFQSLFSLGRKPTDHLITTTDDDMTPDEVKTIVNDAVNPLKTDLAAMQESNTALETKNTALEEQVTALSAELTELKKPDSPTPVPENIGAAGELTYDY